MSTQISVNIFIKCLKNSIKNFPIFLAFLQNFKSFQNVFKLFPKFLQNFHSPPNEPKEVSLQNPNTLMEDDHTTLVVIYRACQSPINLENGGGIEKC